MTLFKAMMSLIVLFNFSFSWARTSPSAVEKRAAVFLLKQTEEAASRSRILFDRGHCEPNGTSVECSEYVAGSYPTTDQKLEAVRACAGNTGAECVKWGAGSYPTFDQKVQAARACRHNRDQRCGEYVAGSYPTFDQKLTALNACQGADVDCVKFAAGSYPTFDQKVAAAKACGGN